MRTRGHGTCSSEPTGSDLTFGPGQLVGVDEVGGEVGERGEHEAALPHPRVRHLQVGLVDLLALDPEDVDVEGPRSPALEPHPRRRRLQPPALGEQAAGVEVGVELDDQVEEGALLGPADRVGLVHGRHGHHVVERGHGRPELGGAVAEVRAQAEEGAGHGRSWATRSG